jgi:hypothetical protein
MNDLIFCNDGVLRVRYNDELPLVDLKSFQDLSGDDDLNFITGWWEENVVFEEGLTIAKFLMCLEPWAKLWSIITKKDIAAYIKESRKPTIVKETDKKWYAVIGYFTDVEPELQHSTSASDFTSFEDFLNNRTPPTLKPKWNFHGHYKLNGHVQGEVEHYSLDYSPMNEMANYPLYLSPNHMVNVSKFYVEKYGDAETVDLFNYDGLGMRSVTHEDRTHHYIIGDKSHNLRDVVEAFFWWLPHSPTSRDAFNAKLKEDLDRLDIDVSKVVEKTVDDETEIKIVVADGAFDGLTSQWEAEKKYFLDGLEQAKKAKICKLRVGGAKEGKVPEKRVSLWLVDDEDL